MAEEVAGTFRNHVTLDGAGVIAGAVAEPAQAKAESVPIEIAADRARQQGLQLPDAGVLPPTVPEVLPGRVSSAHRLRRVRGKAFVDQELAERGAFACVPERVVATVVCHERAHVAQAVLCGVPHAVRDFVRQPRWHQRRVEAKRVSVRISLTREVFETDERDGSAVDHEFARIGRSDTDHQHDIRFFLDLERAQRLRHRLPCAKNKGLALEHAEKVGPVGRHRLADDLTDVWPGRVDDVVVPVRGQERLVGSEVALIGRDPIRALQHGQEIREQIDQHRSWYRISCQVEGPGGDEQRGFYGGVRTRTREQARMTRLRPIDLVCPVCDNHFRSQSVVSTNSHGGKRTDFHEYAVGEQPLPHLVHMCSGCGFSGADRDFVEGSEVSSFVRSQVLSILTPRLAEDRLDSASDRYAAAAQVAEWKGEGPRRVADQLLRAAWCCVEDADHEGERFYRRAAAQKFADALAHDGVVPPTERAVIAYLIGELWRRVGEATLADAWLARVEGEIVDPEEQQWVMAAARQQRDSPREWFT